MTSEIPTELMETAESIVRDMPSRFRSENRPWAAMVIARAILAERMKERQRCAKIADNEPIMPGDPPEAVLAAMIDAGPVLNARAAASATRRSIASKIRGEL